MFLEDLAVGQRASLSKTVTREDIDAFATVSGDRNPVHLDEAFASGTMFKGVIAHGMLSASFISAVLGTELPGEGAIYLGQELKFLAPVRPGDTVVTTVTVKEVIPEKRRVICATTCAVGDTTIIAGEATLMVRSRDRESRA